MAKNYVIHMPADSEAEKKFMETIMPLLKDKVVCRLGILFGHPNINCYVVTENDFETIKKYFAEKILK